MLSAMTTNHASFGVIYVREDNDSNVIGYDYMACMDYMDPDVRCPPKRPLNLITHWLTFSTIALLEMSLHWRHNDHDGVSNHQPHGYLLKRLFRHRSKKTSKLRVTGLCARNSPGTGEFPAQRASNAEFFSIWWRHHGVSDTIPFRVSLINPLHSNHSGLLIQSPVNCWWKHWNNTDNSQCSQWCESC